MGAECRKCGLQICLGNGKWSGQWVEVDQRASCGLPEVCMAISGDDTHEPHNCPICGWVNEHDPRSIACHTAALTTPPAAEPTAAGEGSGSGR